MLIEFATPTYKMFTKENLAELFAGLAEDWIKLIKITLRNDIIEALDKLRLVDPQRLCPPPNKVFEFARSMPVAGVVAVILAQDPYPNETACGLAFSVLPGVNVPPSLKNIAKCLGVIPTHGDLTAWAKQGILLLNTSLTTVQGTSNAHAAIWNKFVSNMLLALAPKYIIALGKHAQEFSKAYAHMSAQTSAPTSTPPCVFSWGHPSPLNMANKRDGDLNFAHCPCFNQLNEALALEGKPIINWDWTSARSVMPAGVQNTLWLFTDGGASSNGKKTCRAKAAWKITAPGRIDEVKCVELPATPTPTNQRAELMAIMCGLQDAKAYKFEKLIVVSDSLYSINCIRTWYKGWIDSGAEKKNMDLIGAAYASYMELSRAGTVQFEHINSHQPKPVGEYELFRWENNADVDKAAGFSRT